MADHEAIKSHFYKVYDKDDNYITTWKEDVISTPSFSWNINGSMGEMKVTLARPLDDFGETEDVALFNKVETWVSDTDEFGGTKIHSGFISGYNTNLTQENIQNINIHILSLTNELEVTILADSGDTTISYNSVEPANIFRNILNLANKSISYNDASIDDTNTTVSYTYKYTTCLDAIKKALELTPAYWYWYINAENLLHLHVTDFDTIDHNLFIGREVVSVDYFKNVENLFNTVYFLGGGEPNLYNKYSSVGSQIEYGERHKLLSDTRVTDNDTAEIISEKFLDENDHFEQQLSCKVLDNTLAETPVGGRKGYNIESLKPGDVVIINHPRVSSPETLWYDDSGLLGNMIWDESFWDFDIRYSYGIPMQIQQINYNFHYADLILSTRLPDINKRIEDTKRNLTKLESDNIPSSP